MRDNRSTNIGLDIDLEDNHDVRVVCEHIHDVLDIDNVHMEYSHKNELLVVQCRSCAQRFYENCDLMHEKTYYIVSDKDFIKIMSQYLLLWKLDNIRPEDVILTCYHDTDVLEDVYKEKTNERY